MAQQTVKEFGVKITSNTKELQTGFEKLKTKLKQLAVSFKKTFKVFDTETKKIAKQLDRTINKNIAQIAKNAKKEMDDVVKAVQQGGKATTKAHKDAAAKVKKIKADAAKEQNAQLKQQTQTVARELKNQLKALDREAEQFGELDVVQINQSEPIDNVQELGRALKTANKTTQEEIRTQLRRLDSQKIEDIKAAEQKLKRILARSQRNQTQAAKEAANRRKQAAGNNAERIEQIERDLQRQLLRIQQQGQARRQSVQQTSAARQQRAPQERRVGRIGRGATFISEVGGAAQGASSRLGVLGQALSKLGPIGIAVGAALAVTVGILLKAAAAAGKLGNEIAKVKTTINPKQFDELSGATQRLRDFSAQTGVELSELTDGMFNAASAVTAFKNDVNAGAEAVIIASKAAVGMNTDSGNLVSVMGDLANSFGINASNTEDLNFIMDTVSQTFRDGKISGDELSSTIVKAAKSTSLLSRDAKEGLTALNAMTASMTASGINATETATAIDALQNEFLDLPKATKLIEAGLGGISTEGGKVQVDFQELFESAGDDFEKYAQLLGSKRAKLAFRTLAGGGESAFLAISEGFQDVSGRSQDAFEIMQDTSEAATKRLDASFNELMISIGGSADGAITNLTNFAAEALGGLAGLFKSAEQQAAESQEAFNQSIETANSIAESITTVKDSIAAAGEVGADEAGIVADEIKNIGETAAQFKDQFPLIADNIQRIINAEGEKTVETLALLNEQLSRAQQFAESEAFLESFEGADVALESVLEKIEKVGPLGGFIAGQFGSPFGDAVKFIEDGLTGLDEQIQALSAERGKLKLTNPEDIERAKELGDEFAVLASKQEQLGRSRLAIETGISTFTDKQIEQARKLAESRGLTFNIDQQMLIIRSQLTDKFGEEGQTLELINDLTKDRLDSELKISAASKDTAESTEEVTKETEKSLAANEALADVLKDQVDITDEKSFISSEINDMTAEILDNETLTTDEKIAQLEEMEAAFQVELNFLNAKVKGLEADHQRAIVAAQNVTLSEEEAAAAWDKVAAIRKQVEELRKQVIIVETGKGELGGKITETGAGGLVTETLGGLGGGGREAERIARAKERAEKDRRKEEDKAAKEAAKAEKDRQKELDQAEKDRIQQEKDNTAALKDAQDAELDRIKRQEERDIAQENIFHERRMRGIEMQQKFQDEQRKLNEQRLQEEKQLNDRLAQIREQQLSELKGVAETSSNLIKDVIRSIIPLTKRQQLELTLDETDAGLQDFSEALANAQAETKEEALALIAERDAAKKERMGFESQLNAYGGELDSTTNKFNNLSLSITRAEEIIGKIGKGEASRQDIESLQRSTGAQTLGDAAQAVSRWRVQANEMKNDITELTPTVEDLNNKWKEQDDIVTANETELKKLLGVYNTANEVLEETPIVELINDQAKLAQQMAFVTNEFQGLSGLIDGLFTQENKEAATTYFETLFDRSELTRVQLEETFPGLILGFQSQLEDLQERITELSKDPGDQDLLKQALKNASDLEFLIGALGSELIKINQGLTETNLGLAQSLIETESKAEDAINSIQDNINRLREQEEQDRFNTQAARIAEEMKTNREVLHQRLSLIKKLLEAELSVPLEEQDFERIVELNQQIQEMETNIVSLDEITPELIVEGTLEDQQNAIDNQKIMIDQQRELGEISSAQAIKKQIALNEQLLALAIDRKDSEEEINAIKIDQNKLEDQLFETQFATLKKTVDKLQKIGDVLTDTGEMVSNISGMFRTGRAAEGIQGAGDLTKKIGMALIGSESQALRTAGAVMLGAGIITKLVGKLIETIRGREQTASEVAEERLGVIERQNESFRNQIVLAEELAGLGDMALDTARERLEFLEQQKKEMLAQSRIGDKPQKDLLEEIGLMEERLSLLDSFNDRLESSKELSNKEQRKLIEDVNETFGTDFDFGKNVTKNDIDEVIDKINTLVAEGKADLSDLELLSELNEGILSEQFALLDERIKNAQFKIKLATEFEDPTLFLQSQEELISTLGEKLNGALEKAGVGAQLSELTKEELLSLRDEFDTLFEDGEVPESVISSWGALIEAIEGTNQKELEFVESQLENEKQMIELIRLREGAAKISTEEADEQVVKLLEEQIKIVEDQIKALGMSVELEMLLLGLQQELNNLKKEENETDEESNRLLGISVRKRQELIETFRQEQKGGTLTGTQRQKLAQSEKEIVAQLKSTGASQDDIDDFLRTLPAFEKGGEVPETGLAWVHKKEVIIPANQAQEVQDQIKSFASIFSANNPTIMGTDSITQDFTRTVLANEAKNIQQQSQISTHFGDIIINIPSEVKEPEKIALAVKNELSNMVLGTVQRGIDQNKIDIRGKKT